jgi:hypothetical protein
MKRILICLAAGVLVLTAQTPKPQSHVEHDVVVMHSGAAVSPPGAMLHFESSVPGPVKGAPFSAESVTESVQVLGDGNRISHKQTGKSFRDGQGRTRTENQIAAIGPWTPDEGLAIVSIHDPVARLHIMLNSKTRTATKIKLPEGPGSASMTFIHSESAPAGHKLDVRVEKKIQTAGASAESSAEASAESSKSKEKDKEKSAVIISRSGPMNWTSSEGIVHTMGPGASKYETRKEGLGKQTMEGVEVEGTRLTMTIPPGALGNERVIEVVTETWRSAALQMDILRKHTDPRYGTTTYRLTAVNRSEPAKSLFEIPADYKVEEPKNTGVRTIRLKEGGGNKTVREEIF